MALEGIRVLDLTRLLPGAFCSLLLADMGADVVKVEQPGIGDPMRWIPPLVDGHSAYFNALGRNKRSLTLDLKAPGGRELFLDLAATAAVVVEGNRPGVLDRLGVGWEVLHHLNPRLVMCAITGYGQTGPLALRAGHDINYMALAGALSLNGERDGPPHPLGVQVADLGGGGQAAALAITGALLGVARGGEGAFLDVSMTDVAATWTAVPAAELAAGGPLLARGHQRLTGRYACYGVYECSDGRYLAVGALEAKFWRELCEAIGRPDLVGAQYEEGEAQDRLREELAAVFENRARDEWVELLAGRDVCCEPVLELDEVTLHPQARARGLVQDRPTGREIRPALPPAPGARRLPPPGLGEHTTEILLEAGLSPERVRTLRAAGAV